jgi:hypothetical protein
MRNSKNSLGLVLSCLFLLLTAFRAQACDRSSLSINSITPQAGGTYAISLRFCVGAGKTGLQYGAGNDTDVFGFFLSDNASFSSYPSQLVSPQTGHVYIDTTAGDDTLVYFSEHYFTGPYEPWACINNCGEIQTVCMDITIVTIGLPDSLWMGGAEAGGNIAGGCEMKVYPSCNGFAMDLGVDKTVCRGYSPMSCTNLVPSITGAVPPLTYNWSNGATSSSINVCPTATTGYAVTVTDSRGCQVTDNIQVDVIDVRCGSNNQKVLVCHNGSTLCVPQSQVATHLNHGDVLGSCSSKSGEPGAALDGPALEYTVTAYPIPASDRISFRIQSPAKGAVTLEVFDLQGQRMAVQKGDAMAAGEAAEMEVAVAGWAPGIYFARLSHPESGVKNVKFTVVK